jgi:hypothetical protein
MTNSQDAAREVAERSMVDKAIVTQSGACLHVELVLARHHQALECEPSRNVCGELVRTPLKDSLVPPSVKAGIIDASSTSRSG